MQQINSPPTSDEVSMQVDPFTLPEDDVRCWHTYNGLAELFPQQEEGQINYSVRQRKVNGLEAANAVTMFGRKQYIHCQRYAKWFNSRLNSKRAINSAIVD